MTKATLNTGLITVVVFVISGYWTNILLLHFFEMIPHSLLEAFYLSNASLKFILFVITLFFFIGCMFAHSIVVLLILTPIFMPIVTVAGLAPVQVGVLVTLQMAIGSARIHLIVIYSLQ